MDSISIAYLVAINLVAFVGCGLDKRAAIQKKWRIPERVLLGLAIAGGGAGMLLGMFVFHHKTKTPKFIITVPVVLVAEIVFLVLAYRLPR
ncbi:MAG: hypothetical protein PWQ08_1234 [Clostridiales bacterium]|nr:DUF1294 domain-containing protein [Pygmaiobacter sp.]MDK2813979.1 hypothetical protein [Clostridiales bacterium]